MRFLFNLIGGILLALALAFAVADITRSLADGATQLTTFREAFASAGLSPGAGVNPSANAVDLAATLAAWPASITLGFAAFLFLFVGRPAHRRGGGRYAR